MMQDPINTITLYRKNSIGIGIWSAWIKQFHEYCVIYMSYASTLDGQRVTNTETVLSGRQGRTTLEQAIHRLNSRVSRQRDKGYNEDITKAESAAMNQLGLPPPMLAQTFDEGALGNWYQKKLNGLRCLITRQDGELILYTRRGKLIKSLNEITADIGDIVLEGDTLDGELYVHGTSLQTIQSWVKRRQTNTGRLVFACYDQLGTESFIDRYDNLKDKFKTVNSSRVLLLPTKPVESRMQLEEEFSLARAKGFEGLMVRYDGYGYESNKRSASLKKMKAKFDDEGVVTDVVLSSKGNPVMVVAYNSTSFRLRPPGSIDNCFKIYEQRASYVGRRIRFEYRELTNDGVPFHAVALEWRED